MPWTSLYVYSQRRFLSDGSDGPNDRPYKWWVPITFTGKSNSDFSNTKPAEWLADDGLKLVIDNAPPLSDWAICNIQQTGYYRVNYDNHNWLLLIQQLVEDHAAIHQVNRAQLLDDVLNLAKAGEDLVTQDYEKKVNWSHDLSVWFYGMLSAFFGW